MVEVVPHLGAAERLLGLRSSIVAKPEFQACVDSLSRQGTATFDSVYGSSCALLIAALAERFESLLVVVADDKAQDNLLDDLPTFYSHSIGRFPACLQGATSSLTVDLEEYGERLRLVKALAADDADPVIVASVPSLLQSVPSLDSIKGHSRRIKVGDQIELIEFQTWLLEQGFHETTAVELPGEFSTRGGIFDIFAPDWAGPVRIELFDDEVESMRQFDGATQRSNANVMKSKLRSSFPKPKTKVTCLTSCRPTAWWSWWSQRAK